MQWVEKPLRLQLSDAAVELGGEFGARIISPM